MQPGRTWRCRDVSCFVTSASAACQADTVRPGSARVARNSAGAAWLLYHRGRPAIGARSGSQQGLSRSSPVPRLAAQAVTEKLAALRHAALSRSGRGRLHRPGSDAD